MIFLLLVDYFVDRSNWLGVKAYGIFCRSMDPLCNVIMLPTNSSGLMCVAMQLAALPRRDILFAVGDWNCRVGTRQQGGAPPEVLGPHGIGQRNANGDLLLQLAVGKGLRLLNSFYQHDLAHTASWYHCRWHTPGVLDHAVCYQDHARCVDDVRAIPGAEVISDHRLMVMSLSVKPQLDFVGRRDRTFSQGVLRPRKLCLSKVTEAQHRQAFSTSLANGMATQQGPLTFDTLPRLLRTGEQAFGTAASSVPDWRQGNEEVLQNLAANRQEALHRVRACPGDAAALHQLRQARHDSQRVARELKKP